MHPEQSCGSCRTPLSASANFCSECGAAVTRAAPRAEYKQVTVLFADVVHSMDIAAAVGAERLREIMTELVGLSAAVVQRYGVTVDQFTGDGIMAVFGAPRAVEDHAVRACFAALAIQEEAKRLAVDVLDRDGEHLMLRIGLNSGQVIAGEIGSSAFGYTAVGEPVGMAQRMESIAPPGAVMVSASTARLVEGNAILGEPEMVRIKGFGQPVPAIRLLGMRQDRMRCRTESNFVGRHWEMAELEASLERAMHGDGAVVTVVGPPGIGKSRLVRELSATALARGIEIATTFCESHTSQIPFHVIARFLRAATRVEGQDAQTAGDLLRQRFFDEDPEDLLLLADLLGIADPGAVLPRIDPDARRRRLTALVNAASVTRENPTLYVIEDAHWVDEVSGSMLAEFMSVIAQTSSLVVVTYRPEYGGALTRVPGARTMALAPLSGTASAALVAELLGSNPSVSDLGTMIMERAAGTPLFAEEIVRELAERGVLEGESCAYHSTASVADVAVPATLQAIIGARIDRLDTRAKRTLTAAAVIGSRFSCDLLIDLGVEPETTSLVSAQLIDQVGLTPSTSYAFHHPLIRAVAYESQLRSDRALMHRRVAAALEGREPASGDENAALIAEHLEAAGDLQAAYDWHMRAANWARSRDINASRLSWERARIIADSARIDDPNRAAMRIAPRTMLCATAYRERAHGADARFDELRQLCTASTDKPSLAIAMAGLVMDHAYQGHIVRASRLATEAMALIESLDDTTLTVGLSYPAIYAKIESGEYSDVLRWSQHMVDLAHGDPFAGNFIFGSPLALALVSRAMASYHLGLPDWRTDLRRAVDLAHRADPLTYAAVVALCYFPGIANGVLSSDDQALREAEDALQIAERSGNDMAVAFARFALGITLVHGEQVVGRDRGQALLAEVSDVFERNRHNVGDLPVVNAYLARERAKSGDRDGAIPQMRAAVDQLVREKQLLAWGIPVIGVLVETLLARAADGDIAEAETAIDQLAVAPANDGLILRDIWVLRLRALLSKARRDDLAYRALRDRYRESACALGLEGHVRWAESML